MASTVLVSPSWTLQNLNTAPVGRLHDGAFLQQVATTPNTQVRPGVIPTVGTGANSVPIDLFVSQLTSPAMSVQVQPGNWVATNASNRGPYVAGAVGITTLTVTTANPSNPRLDLVYAQVIDTAASDTGTSSSIIGIVTGTASGSPVLPALPTNGVCISLGQVAVAAGATSITNSNITDLRKSTAVGRGPRFLLPGDSLTDPGFCYGEQRQRFLSSYTTGTTGAVATVVTDYWGFDSRWHGSNRLIVPQPTQTGSGTISTGSNAVISSFTIPDPGFPYHVKASGSIAWTNVSSAGIGAMGVFLYAQLDTTTPNTNIVTQGFMGNYTASAGTTNFTDCAEGNSSKLTPAGYTGSHTLNLCASTTGSACSVATGLQYQFSIEIVPA